MNADLAALLGRPIAHRGLHGCGGFWFAEERAPEGRRTPGPVENSLGAARAAIAAGYGIECDVQLSRDGEAMVFHDDMLERLTGTAGRLADLDAAALTRLALAGSDDHIPTLAGLLATIDGRVPLVIEIKSAGDGDMRLVERTLAVLARYPGAAAIESFDSAPLLHAKSRGTKRSIGLVGPSETGDEPDADILAACEFLSWSIADLSRIAACHPHIPLTTWTIRTPAQAAQALDHSAQIVFEGFLPSQLINDDAKLPRDLRL